MSNGPIEPSANAREFARASRDFYLALVIEGFTPSEALQIIGYAIAANGGQQ